MKKDEVQALAGIVLFYAVIESLGVTCPIRFLTGISCAGCGMSRAWLSLLGLDLAAAFAFHPLFWLVPPTAVVLLLGRRVPERARRIYLSAVGGLFVIVYLSRLVSPEDQVVVFQPAQGLVPRIVSGLLGTGG